MDARTPPHLHWAHPKNEPERGTLKSWRAWVMENATLVCMGDIAVGYWRDVRAWAVEATAASVKVDKYVN